MYEITSKQVKSLRVKLKLTQEKFAEQMQVSGSAIGGWETGTSPNKVHGKQLLKLYLREFPPKDTDNNSTNSSNGSCAKGGRHKISVMRVAEIVSEIEAQMLAVTTEARARKVAEKYNLDFAVFREALVVFCYGMESMPTKNVAQVLAGHE